MNPPFHDSRVAVRLRTAMNEKRAVVYIQLIKQDRWSLAGVPVDQTMTD